MKRNNPKYYIINKPFGVLSQFSDKGGRETLKKYFNLRIDVYPVGRLDKDSEGLLLLTNDKSLNNFLLNPKNHQEKEYFVQVEGVPGNEEIKELEEGVVIEGQKTLPAKVKKIDEPKLWERIPPVRERKSIPVSWLSIVLIEGRNRQVRKMTAKVGFPTLRLVRVRIKNLATGNLQPGQFRELIAKEIRMLKKERLSL